MKLRDLLTAGVKLLGAYFTVEGVYEVVVFGLRWLLAYLGQLGYTISPTRIDDFIRLELTTGVGAMVFLMAAFLLIRRTSWCVSKLLEDPAGIRSASILLRLAAESCRQISRDLLAGHGAGPRTFRWQHGRARCPTG